MTGNALVGESLRGAFSVLEGGYSMNAATAALTAIANMARRAKNHMRERSKVSLSRYTTVWHTRQAAKTARKEESFV